MFRDQLSGKKKVDVRVVQIQKLAALKPTSHSSGVTGALNLFAPNRYPDEPGY